MFNLFVLVPSPKVSVTDADTENVPVTVIVVDEPERVQFALTVRPFKDIVGTAVIANVCGLLIITLSPAAGTNPVLQLDAVVHTPPVVGSQVFVSACVNDESNKIHKKQITKNSVNFFILFFPYVNNKNIFFRKYFMDYALGGMCNSAKINSYCCTKLCNNYLLYVILFTKV